MQEQHERDKCKIILLSFKSNKKKHQTTDTPDDEISDDGRSGTLSGRYPRGAATRGASLQEARMRAKKEKTKEGKVSVAVRAKCDGGGSIK